MFSKLDAFLSHKDAEACYDLSLQLAQSHLSN